MVQEYAQFLQLCQSFAHNSARAPKVFRCVRCGNESGLELRRCKINAALQTTVEKSGEHLQIASLRACEIMNWFCGKEQTKQ